MYDTNAAMLISGLALETVFMYLFSAVVFLCFLLVLSEKMKSENPKDKFYKGDKNN